MKRLIAKAVPRTIYIYFKVTDKTNGIIVIVVTLDPYF